jgi:hexosaminidase
MRPYALLFLAIILAACGGRIPVEEPVPPLPEVTLADRYPLIPWPANLEPREGSFVVDDRTRFGLSDPSDPELRRLSDLLAGWIRNAIAVDPPVLAEPVREPGPRTIALMVEPGRGDGSGPEGYRLTVTSDGVTLRASSHAGLFYGVQTLRQLLPADADTGPVRRPRFRAAIPAVEIDDAPRFGYRGLHLDVGRHLFPVEFIKKYLDAMARYKLNRFHWHLTEDQGWRIEIQRYPRLTEVAAFRDETVIGHAREQPRQFDGRRYGGFYTQEEMREIVRYAAERHITVIPEIELPGHSTAALAAYPELACTPGPFEVATTWGIFEDIYCPSEATFEFLENVLTEVMALFPSEYIHIGGDEAPKARWRESPIAQEVIRREGLADEDELQSWFIRRIERFLNAHGRKLIGWDEIVEGGLSPTATVMYWRNWHPEVPVQATAQGNDLIMTPNDRLYLDHYQAPPEGEPLAIGGLTTLEDVYTYEPVPADFTPQQARHILGAQGNVWTEYMKTPERVEYMVFPRALALAEVVWSPAAARDWDGFQRRAAAQVPRLDVNWGPGVPGSTSGRK